VPDPLSPTPPKGVALFDLDGTLIAWDCQLLFRHFVLRREPWRGVFLPLFLAFLPLAGLLGSEGMKRVFLSFLWRIHPDTLSQYAREFAQSLTPGIYQEMHICIDREHAKGHLLILTSASPELYVVEIGKLLGFDLAIGTPVEFGPLFPDIDNNKGLAKVTRLKQLLPPSYFEDGKLHNSRAYTDSRADLPMIALCETATVVNPSKELTALAAESDWKIMRPARPWRTRAGFALRAMALLLGIGSNPAGIKMGS